MVNHRFSAQIDKLKIAVEQAEAIIIGAGSGLSAASGLCYDDFDFFDALFPQYYEHYLLRSINESTLYQFATVEEQYAFWTRFIFFIRYNFPAGRPYQDLYRVISGKPHFILTANTDGQFLKSGFNPEIICALQGDYAFFQCSRPCNNAIYDNKRMILTMFSNIMDDAFSVPSDCIPRCPDCGSPLIPNIRNSGVFVEKPWLEKYREFTGLINANSGKDILLLELGAGINTPGIIGDLFEQILQQEHSSLIRINLNVNNLPRLYHAGNAVTIQGGIGIVLAELAKNY
jgi:NAD-dependent SIR2 family protein deacetylase